MIHKQYPYSASISGVLVESQREMNADFRSYLEKAFKQIRETQAADYVNRHSHAPIPEDWRTLYEQERDLALAARGWVVGL